LVIGLYRVLRVVINSFAFVLCLLLAITTFEANPWLALLFLAASFDQLEDVYYYVYGRRLMPRALMPLDLVFEGVMFMVGLAMLMLSVSYYAYFSTWLFRGLLFLSIMVLWSSVEDVIEWARAPKATTPPPPTPPAPPPPPPPHHHHPLHPGPPPPPRARSTPRSPPRASPS
jgi:hypothetical protein